MDIISFYFLKHILRANFALRVPKLIERAHFEYISNRGLSKNDSQTCTKKIKGMPAGGTHIFRYLRESHQFTYRRLGMKKSIVILLEQH